MQKNASGTKRFVLSEVVSTPFSYKIMRYNDRNVSPSNGSMLRGLGHRLK